MIRNLFQEFKYWFMDQHIYVHYIKYFLHMLVALFKFSYIMFI